MILITGATAATAGNCSSGYRPSGYPCALWFARHPDGRTIYREA
jgi:hypothetical protein